MMTTKYSAIILAIFWYYGTEAIDSFSDWDRDEVAERIQALDYRNVCKCQCKNETVFVTQRNRVEGNCMHKLRGKYWCYIDDQAAKHCRHSQDGVFKQLKWSIDACYTPPTGEGPCASDYSAPYPLSVNLCAEFKGTYNPSTFDPQMGGRKVCYVPNDDLDDAGCQDRVESGWGQAKPCRCENISYQAGHRPLRRRTNRFLYCGPDQLVGQNVVYISATGGTGHRVFRGIFKAYQKCKWKPWPTKGGPWRCVRN